MMLVTLELKASKLLNTLRHKRLDYKTQVYNAKLNFYFPGYFWVERLFFHTKLRYRKLKLILIYF